jgi:hypothetical protein
VNAHISIWVCVCAHMSLYFCIACTRRTDLFGQIHRDSVCRDVRCVHTERDVKCVCIG